MTANVELAAMVRRAIAHRQACPRHLVGPNPGEDFCYLCQLESHWSRLAGRQVEFRSIRQIMEERATERATV